MFNSRPNNSNYHQGNYLPKNKDKVLKLNSEGGVYYRSSLEKKIMIWLDSNEKIRMWGAECMKIPYQLVHGDLNLSNHVYYPDFYYELKIDEFNVRKVVMEVKPMAEYKMVSEFMDGKIKVPDNATVKKLKNFEYSLKTCQKNAEKWKNMIKYCELKGWEFIIVTEEHLKKLGL